MDESGTTTLERDDKNLTSGSGRDAAPPRRTGPGDEKPGASPGGSGAGFFSQYKPEQGKATRTGTMIAAGALIAWGSYFIWGRLEVYGGGDDIASLLVTVGIPILYAVVLGGVLWWLTYSNRKSSDFMIATEGEMKKVNWSTQRELIGSTKVVILFTVLMAAYLFGVDLVFQKLFMMLGVLKT